LGTLDIAVTNPDGGTNPCPGLDTYTCRSSRWGRSISLHCDPYKMSVTAALEDIVLREDLPTIQVCKLGKSGLCTDGPYSSAVLGLAVGILAVASIAAVDDLPLHVQRFLGAIRVSAQPDIGGKDRLLRCISSAPMT